MDIPDHTMDAAKDKIIESLREELALTNSGIVALNMELEDKMRELELLNGELKSFAYSVSHDLRQPLRAIDSFAKLFQDEYAAQVDDQGRDYLERISRGAKRMDAMIEGLLSLSRVTRKELAPKAVALDAVARTVLAELEAQQPGRRVDVHIGSDMTVVADPQLMESVVQNLLSNAWKYSVYQPNATISFRRDYVEGEKVFVVEDNGAGFDMQYSSKLFNVFQRLHAKDEFDGIGIGLATTQRIIHRHGGRIWVRSAPNQGASFMFTLPGGA